MIDLTRTTTALLDGLGQGADDPAWVELDRRYRPLLAAVARRSGLGDAEAADAAQETLADFLVAYRGGRYDRGKGRLRSWLLGMQRRKVVDIVRDRARRGVVAGVTAVQDLPGEQELERIWEEEQQRFVFDDAVRALGQESGFAPVTVRAFELTGLRGLPAAQVAEQLGMTTDDVYAAKSRCLKRIRALIEERSAAFEGD